MMTFRCREPKEGEQARRADRLAKRLRERLATLPRRGAAPWTGVVVGGRGDCRRLAGFLAPLLGDMVIEAGAPIETVDALERVAEQFVAPRVVLLAPAKTVGPFLEELGARCRFSCVDLLHGMRAREREAFMRRAIGVLRSSSC